MANYFYILSNDEVYQPDIEKTLSRIPSKGDFIPKHHALTEWRFISMFSYWIVESKTELVGFVPAPQYYPSGVEIRTDSENCIAPWRDANGWIIR